MQLRELCNLSKGGLGLRKNYIVRSVFTTEVTVQLIRSEDMKLEIEKISFFGKIPEEKLISECIKRYSTPDKKVLKVISHKYFKEIRKIDENTFLMYSEVIEKNEMEI